jgi:hypothetical protein
LAIVFLRENKILGIGNVGFGKKPPHFSKIRDMKDLQGNEFPEADF